MDKRVILASAGSGKTYYITHSVAPTKRAYIISFTNRNVDNILRELNNHYSNKIPSNIIVSTFDTFVFHQLIKPYSNILDFVDKEILGVDVITKPQIDGRRGDYKPVSDPAHYMNINQQLYVNRMSKLFMKQSESIKTTILKRLEKYCDCIYFDEFQDYNGFDFKVLHYIIENASLNVIAVGDIFQSLVTPIRNDGNGSNKPFSCINNVNDLRLYFSEHIEIDTNTLNNSRRITLSVSEFIQEHLSINIGSNSELQGNIIWVDDIAQIDLLMRNKSIPKLVWNRKSVINPMETHINWSYSKGDTYKESCIILTNETSDLSKWNQLSPSIRNKLYVALTRATGNVYLITKGDFDNWKQSLVN